VVKGEMSGEVRGEEEVEGEGEKETVEEEDVEMVRLLVRSGSNLDALDSNGRTPLMRAAMNGRPGCVQCLLEVSEKEEEWGGLFGEKE
jgi:hypothetical protein